MVGEVEKSIADAAKSGQTMILVSHDMSFVAQVADKILFLDKGKIIDLEHRMRLSTILKKSGQKNSSLVTNGLIFDIIDKEKLS